jgi:beta-lactamase regulating signal transducer with metallopeptidase domain
MQSYLLPENEPWLELVLVLAAGTVVIVGLAALADRLVRSAVWQRTLWQVTTLGLLVLMLVELTGTAPALVRLWRAGAEGLSRKSVALWENSPARQGEVPDLSTRPTPPSRAGLSVNARARIGSATSDLAWLDDVHLPADEPPVEPAFWWLGAIWAFGAVVMTARTVCVRTLLFALWRRRTAVSDGPLCERVAKLARRLGIRRRVRVLEAAELRAPVAFGSFRPTVAVPITFAHDFDRQQQGVVLAHELAHLAARDPAWQLVAGLLCAVLWWHPLAWWSRYRLHAASEAAADEASLLVPDGPDLLAACLVAMGRRLAPPRQLGWLSVEGPGFRSSLGRRVERLLNLRRRPWRAPGRGRLLFAKCTLPAALVILAVCCTAWARPQATPTEGGTTMQVIRTSWRQSLAAAALAVCSAGRSDAVADDPAIDASLPAVVAGDLSDTDGQLALALLAEDERREAREREGRERPEGERGERREGEGRERRFAQLLHELEERAQRLRRKFQDLRDGQDAEVREIQGTLHEIEQRMGAIRRELRGPERPDRERPYPDRPLPDRPQPEREQLKRRLEELLAAAGRHEEAEAREREAREIIRQLERRPDRPRPGSPEDLERRTHHLRIAVENLHAAGLHEQAEHLAQQMLLLLEEHHRGDQPPPPPEYRDRPPHPELGHRLEQQDRAIDELGGAVRQLHRQMSEMREALERLLGKPRGEAEEGKEEDNEGEESSEEQASAATAF